MSNLFYDKNDVAIIYNENESQAILDGLKNLQAEQQITSTDVVVLTPNWVNNTKTNPADGVVVGQESLRTVIKWIKERNPKRIIVGCGSGNGDTPQVMKDVGYDKIINEEQVEFIDFNKGPYVDLPINNNKPNKIKVNSILSEMTYYISFTQLKCHEEATMSSSIKNMAMSWPSTEEHGSPKKNLGIHDDLHGFIVAMAEKIKINLSIVSANPVMIGTGPTKGIDRHTGIVVCGNNPISVDTICARLLGYKSQGIAYLYQLETKGYKETKIESIPMKGISLVEAEKIFTEKAYGEQMIMEGN